MTYIYNIALYEKLYYHFQPIKMIAENDSIVQICHSFLVKSIFELFTLITTLPPNDDQKRDMLA